MKKFVVAAALALAVLVSPVANAQDISAAERNKVEKIVKEMLDREPELIMQAAQKMQQRDQQRQLEAATSGIRDNKKDLFESKSPAAGAKDAKAAGVVTVVEFFDYNCGFCKRAHPVAQDLKKDDAKVRYVYKQFPILGPTSLTASQWAVAANKQGKFNEFHNALMELKEPVSDAALERIANNLKLNVAKLKTDAVSAETKALIDADLDLGRKVGVQGTPGFIIGEKLYPGAMDLATMKTVVQEARK